MVGLWGADEELSRAKDRLLKLGVDQVLTRISEAAEVGRQLGEAANEPANMSPHGRPAQRS
jgi:hypothetical protein